jgi:hypothetical protein
MTAATRSLLAVTLLALGCGSDTDDDGKSGSTSSSSSGDPNPPAVLDCPWIQSQNCWKQVLDEVAACIPQPAAGNTPTAMLDTSGFSCTYPDGTLITFDQTLAPTDLDPIGLTATKNGAHCLRFESAGVDMDVSVPSGKLTVHAGFVEGQDDVALTITCPDGSAFRADNYTATAQQCESDPSNWPGLIIELMGMSHTGLALSGGNANGGQTTVFFCQF